MDICDRFITGSSCLCGQSLPLRADQRLLQAHDGVWTITPLLLAMTLLQSLDNTVITCEGLVVLCCGQLWLDKPAKNIDVSANVCIAEFVSSSSCNSIWPGLVGGLSSRD